MRRFLVAAAAEAFEKGDYSKALGYYRRLSAQIGSEFFQGNAAVCKRRLRITALEEPEEPEFRVDRILIFTNLALSVIDGSAVSLANTVNVFCAVAKAVHLLCTAMPGENFIARMESPRQVSLLHCRKEEAATTISKLDAEHGYARIFVRFVNSPGDGALWFSERYAHKVILHWAGLQAPNEENLAHYQAVDTVAFQTGALRERTFANFGPKKSLLIPPLIPPLADLSERESIAAVAPVVVSYVGTLRPECCSIELITVMLSILQSQPEVVFYLLISKLFYKDAGQKKQIQGLIDQLRKLPNAVIEEQASPERCEWVMRNSDVGFSLWKPTASNVLQISTKLLENLRQGVHTICFDTALYQQLFGKDYPFFVKDEREIEGVLTKAIEKAKTGTRFQDNYLLSHYSLEAHKSRLHTYFEGEHRSPSNSDRVLFNAQFDKIYGLYIDATERERLQYLIDNHGIDISPFEGVNGKAMLQEEFEAYLKLPFASKWERGYKKKRLSIGAMGHLHSFIRIAENALANGYRKILIIEADVQVHRLAFMLNAVHRPEDFKVLYYGAGQWDANFEFLADHLYKPFQTTGSFAIAFDRSVLGECLKAWRKLVDPSDMALQEITDRHPGKCFVFSPNLFIADVASSNTSGHRSQQALAEKFGWKLADYHVGSVAHVGCYVKTLSVVSDHVLPRAWVKIYAKGRSARAELSETCKAMTLEINANVEKIEYRGAFVKDFELTGNSV